uniref:DUF1985 domain-containing protein n=1 Tax=Brassica oleracea var. oleracea TaxID=109376 RepID=A0A0D3BMN7_BRAOL
MDELGLPLRMFEAGSEPSGRKRVNNYFNLRWIDIIKSALEEEDLEMLNESQFRRVLQMGSHTFSVMFLHYCLSRQLVTAKENELWWIFIGKPIRYAIQDFALVTGLNCGDGVGLTGEAAEKGIGRGKASGKGKSSMSIWDDLFRGEEKPTPGWIMERLVKGKKYKGRLTRLRLSLLVLVEGILCPTCGTTKIRPEIASMLGDLVAFLKYPWGRESFILTVRSTKARYAVNYVKDTMAIQGFTHAMVLVIVTACPSIIIKTGGADPLADSTLSSEEIISRVVDRKVVVNIVSAKTVDQLGQAYVRSLISTDEEGEDLYRGLGDKEDTSVDTMVALIDDDYPFEHNTWSGGVKADEPVEKDNAHHGGVESGGYPGDPRGKSSANPSGAPHGGESFHFDVQTLLRRAADAYEEKVIAMYEGYILSLKGHFNSEDPLRPSTGSGTDVPQTSADVIPEKVGLDGVHDDRGEAAVGKKGEDVDEDDVTITKVQVGRGNTDAAGGQADGGRRFSRRTHTSTKRYTPPAPTVRKKEGNKKVSRQMDDNAPPPKRVKKVSVEPSNPKPRPQEKPTFIGGFSPFTPPPPTARKPFLKIMAEAKSNAPSLGSVIFIASLDDVFNCTGVCSYEVVDRVVGWIRKRRDSNPSSKFDFIPPTFFMDLIRSYPAFEAMQDKAAFT